MELRRLVMGKIGLNELVQRQKGSYFKVKKTRPTTDWNGLVSLAYKEDEDFRIADGPIQHLKRTYASLNNDSLQDNGELRAKLDMVKAKKDEEKEAKRAKKSQMKDLPRVRMYESDLEQLLTTARGITQNYGQHLVVVGVNESINQQNMYPRFTYATSGKYVN